MAVFKTTAFQWKNRAKKTNLRCSGATRKVAEIPSMSQEGRREKGNRNGRKGKRRKKRRKRRQGRERKKERKERMEQYIGKKEQGVRKKRIRKENNF